MTPTFRRLVRMMRAAARTVHEGLRINVEVGKVMLVDQGTIKPEIFADGPLVEVLAVRLSRQFRVAKPIGQLRLRTNVVRDARVGGLIEGVKLHLPTSSSG